MIEVEPACKEWEKSPQTSKLSWERSATIAMQTFMQTLREAAG
jgi:hypothetical protein